MNLPGIIGERLFNIFDKDKDNYVKEEEFIETVCLLFDPSFDKKLTLVFELFDFDRDGFVTKEDISIVLSHAPIDDIVIFVIKLSLD